MDRLPTGMDRLPAGMDQYPSLPAGMDTIHRPEQFTDVAVYQKRQQTFPLLLLHRRCHYLPLISSPQRRAYKEFLTIPTQYSYLRLQPHRQSILRSDIHHHRCETIYKTVLRLFRGALPAIKGRRETHLPSIHPTESYP
jgi:hypothetical protein